MTFAEAMETTKIYSVSGRLPGGQGLVTSRPFRSPHHTISDVALIGGGVMPRPGEISLAHNGVLFLDELPEFKKHVLEVLRQPLEEGQVYICRAQTSVKFPAAVMLVVAMNPCPCGYATDPNHECRCSQHQIALYRSRISGPLLDRIDIHVEVPAVRYRDLKREQKNEPSKVMRERVCASREIQSRRFAESGIFCNAQMSKRRLQRHCRLSSEGHSLLESVMDKLGMSARGTDRILKVARTIADLDECTDIGTTHLAEAIGYRSLDRGVRTRPTIKAAMPSLRGTLTRNTHSEVR
jgi:magnesium chelatase family protein